MALGVFAVTASVASAAIGATVLLGWRTEGFGLATPGWMAFPTAALLAILAGASLALQLAMHPSLEARRVAISCATLVVATAATHLIELVLGLDAGLAGEHAVLPFEEALGFLLVGMGLAMHDVVTSRGTRVAEPPAIAGAAIGALGLTGQAFIGGPFPRGEHVLEIAPATALVLLLLALGTLAARPERGLMAVVARRSPGSSLVRRVVPLAAALVWLLGGGSLQLVRHEVVTPELGATFTAVCSILVLIVVGIRAARTYDDVDARRLRAEAILGHRQKQFRAILHHAPVAIYVKAGGGEYVFANRHAAGLVGRKVAEVLGLTDHDFFPADLADAIQEHDERVLHSGEPIEIEEEAMLEDGLHHYASVKFPLRDQEGKVSVVCGISIDVTARRQSEAARARLQEELAITNRLLAVLASSDDDAMYAAVLAVLCEAFASPVGLMGHIDDEGSLVCPAAVGTMWTAMQDAPLVIRRAEWPRWIERVLVARETVVLDEPHECPGARQVLTRSLATPIVQRGMLLGMIVLGERPQPCGDSHREQLAALAVAMAPAIAARLERVLEAQRRHQTEQELRDLARRLQTSNESLESFSYSVSHDLRAPLRAIGGFARILQADHADALDAEGRRLLGVVTDNTRKMTRLIDDLLAFSRANRRELVRQAVDVDVLVRDVIAETRSLYPSHDVTVRVAPLPPVMADPGLLRMVFANLVSNAWKFTQGRPAATIEVAGGREGNELIYVIRDNGVGLDMRYADKLFGVFSRLHTDEFEGTGVGLAIVRRLVERHGGRVWADGQVAIGATFSFALPVCGEMDEQRNGSDAVGGGRSR